MPEAMQVFDSVANDQMNDLADIINDATDKMDQAIQDLMDNFNQNEIPDITDEFLELFWLALEAIYKYVDPYDRD